jgi:WYL_2, Sm-like SH3 beta-barrel fold
MIRNIGTVENKVSNKQPWRDPTQDFHGLYANLDTADREIFKSWLKELLLHNTARVVFVKSDGSERRMSCTLDPQRGAVYSVNESKKKSNSEVCVVWDCEQRAWRSFRWDRLRSVEFSLA